ncbi:MULTISPECIES: hypothetical protein [Halomonadaceae]|uniref:hypothetical protein n=1 Tax=Halomonadaceae TaxID=28256 RepID=UPI0012EF0ACA|nr:MULTISPECIES: hypothetical protein [Halomonas]CAD5248446.1 conserved membrane hypothetical protein [Halomonas sp. 59]CAD5248551.1 conserved membrane hypothetical protein [Halomonas sp. 113]CAD5251808.1 conserved membrane hypothetical protein [Halomonas sp. 156]CAD5256997.1 conserved membrane hypothetical protein [Halomonas sp. I3]VXC00627.1 conserved membrane hypothetical protein [Halomonas titanicae]
MKYLYELGAALACYMVVLVASLIALTQFQDADFVVRAAITLSPVIPAAFMCWAVVRQLRRLDEMQLRIQFEALGFAFAASALFTFSYGFMENIGAPHLPWLWVWPVMAMMWIVGLMIAKKRYQ